MTKAQIKRALNTKIEKLLVSPELANKFLKKNIKNRDLKPKQMITLRKALENGHWIFNGDTITFDKDGNVVDGQHRLQMVIDTGISIVFIVVYGVDVGAKKTKDTGAKRNLADYLQMEGYANATNLAATIRAVSGYYVDDAPKCLGESPNRYTVTVQDGLEILEAHPELIKSSWYAINNKKNAPISPCAIATLYQVLTEISDEVGTEFMDQLINGTNLKFGSPIWKVRNFLLQKKMDSKCGKCSSLRIGYVCAVIIKAWNHEVQGWDLTDVELKRGESFPLPVSI